MGTRRTVGVALAAVPGLGFVVAPHAPILAALAGTVVVLGALHGLGRVVGRLAGDDTAPFPLVLAWGLAAWIALAGPLIALGVFGIGRTGLAIAGCAAGIAWASQLRVRERVHYGRFASAFALALATLYILGTAGRGEALFVDGESSILGQLQRLHDTGGLGDAIGFPRALGLGGHLAATSLAGFFDGPLAAHAIDRGIAFAIALGLLLLLASSARSRFTAIVVFLLASAAPELGADLSPSWTIIALVLATWATLERAKTSRQVLVAIGLAAAIATVRHAGLGFAIVTVLAMPRRRAGFAVLGAILTPYVIAAIVAWSRGGDLRLAMILPRPGVAIGWMIAGLVVAELVHLGTQEQPLRSVGFALAAALALCGLAIPLESASPLLAALAIAFVVAALRADASSAPNVIVTGIVVGALTMARYRAHGEAVPLTWSLRLGELVADAHALGDRPPFVALAHDHAAALAAIPAGARVGTWTDRGDLFAYDAHAIVDLRTAPLRRCRDCTTLAARIPRLGIEYLVIATASAPPAIVEAFRGLGTVHASFGDVIVVRCRVD